MTADPSASDNMPLLPLEAPGNLTMALARRLSGDIRSGRLKPGERLPTEIEMMRQVGVSRTVVREAVAALRAEGLVQTRQGVGAFVRTDATAQPFRLDGVDSASIQHVLHVLDLRIGVEAEAAAIAAESRTADDLMAIEAAHDAFCAAMTRGDIAIAEDFAFHRAILLATGNPHFPRFLDFLGQIIIPRQLVRAGLEDGRARRDYLARVSDEHLAILLAIRSGNALSAQTTMRAHLTAGRDRYRTLAEHQPPHAIDARNGSGEG